MKRLKLNGFGARQITLLSLVILIAAAGYINLSHEEEQTVPASAGVTETSAEEVRAETVHVDYFADSKLERDKARGAAQEIYREIATGKDSTGEVRNGAQADLAASAKAAETEALIEGILKAKGFDGSIVYVTGAGANVVVKTIGLTPAQAAQIRDAVNENTGLAADNIKIVEIQ